LIRPLKSPRRSIVKRISPGAYQALREALPVVFWYKRPFESHLRMALRDHPELLVGLNFRDTKRLAADELVDRLAQREDRYQQASLQLMTEVASMERFHDLEKLEDAPLRLADARAAVAELRRWTEKYSDTITERDRVAAELAAAMQQAEAARRFADEIEALRGNSWSCLR
jgi:DNA repair ATPase RecN